MAEKSGKKPIPGPVYIVIGTAMILMSVLVDPESLLVFILAGAIFILIGMFKIMMKLEEGRKKTHHHTHHTQQHKAEHHEQHKTIHETDNHKSPSHVKHTQVIKCANCGVKLHPQFKYCPNCGQKLM